jgi:hypothetical protein
LVGPGIESIFGAMEIRGRTTVSRGAGAAGFSVACALLIACFGAIAPLREGGTDAAEGAVVDGAGDAASDAVTCTPSVLPNPDAACLCFGGGLGMCEILCPLGNCNVTCPPSANCAVECAGGGCVTHCGAETTCTIAGCLGGHCQLDCAKGASCSIDNCTGLGCTCAGPGCP